jgi:hypothetical protein
MPVISMVLPAGTSSCVIESGPNAYRNPSASGGSGWSGTSSTTRPYDCLSDVVFPLEQFQDLGRFDLEILVGQLPAWYAVWICLMEDRDCVEFRYNV